MPVAAIDITAGDRSAVFAAIGEYGRHVRGAVLAVAIREWFETFVNVPAHVFAAPHNGNLLDAILADIADPQVAGDGVKAEPPRFAQAIGPNLRAHIGPSKKRVVGRNRVSKAGIGVVNINTQHFAKLRGQILAVTLRILLRAGVTHSNVEKAIRAERQTATAMVLCHTYNLNQSARSLA